MKPTYEQALVIIEKQQAMIEKQQKIITQLENRVTELEERLGLNSKNSSKPPSTDQKKNKQAPKGGAVKGHAGHHRKMYPIEDVSNKVISSLLNCSYCGSQKIIKSDAQIFQQVEIPEIKPIVTQIELEKGVCSCCNKRLIAPFPADYDKSAFGPRLISFIGACSAIYRMSKRIVKTLLATLCNIEISLGSIPAMERKIGKSLQPSYESLLEKINKSKIAYIDETGFRQSAKTHYVWTVTTPNEALIRILHSREIDSLNQIRPRGHPGITISDRYQVYRYDKHQYCLAHIKRDFEKFSQRKGADGEIAERALGELREIFIACHLPSKEMRSRVYYRKKKLQDVLNDAFANGSNTFSRFADRILNQFHRLFLFTKYPGIECTNNAAERTLRHIVMWRKTSYGTQSAEGSRFLERAVSIWMTLRKQERQILPFFEQAYRATFQPKVPLPII